MESISIIKTDNVRSYQPFLKWAGGKRWLHSQRNTLFPENFNTYIEPFAGSASIFFHLAPDKAILADVNEELIGTYHAIQSDWQMVKKHLQIHQRQHSKEYYYKVRSSKPRTLHTRAARMIYLNRTCWNGLYRVNLKGEFNVPIGTNTKVIMDSDDFKSTSELLSGKTILNQDFEVTIKMAEKDDFVFVDPPYTVKHNYNGFIKYNETLFAWKDQIRLKKCIDKAVDRGAKVLITNADHDSIRELYAGYQYSEKSRHSVISGKSIHRTKVTELMIRVGW